MADEIITLVPVSWRRIPEMVRMIDSMSIPPNRVVAVMAGSPTYPDPPFRYSLSIHHLISLPYTGMRIAQWWNIGLDYIEHTWPHADYIFMPGSDVTGKPGAVTRLADEMSKERAVMGGPAWWTAGEKRIWSADDRRDVHSRVPGSCFMIDAIHRLRCDARYRWWYSDDDLEMQARRIGPVGVFPVDMFHDNGTSLTDEQSVHAIQDREYFVNKWGHQPW
jgi:hypothetical protein